MFGNLVQLGQSKGGLRLNISQVSEHNQKFGEYMRKEHNYPLNSPGLSSIGPAGYRDNPNDRFTSQMFRDSTYEKNNF